MQDAFGDASLMEEARAILERAQGWFSSSPSMRVGKGIFCMGFHDKASGMRVLDDCSERPMCEAWFQCVGHGKPGECAEDFRHLYAQYRKRDFEFLEYIKDVVL